MTMCMYFHVNIFLVGIGIPLILNTKIKIDEIVAKYRKCSINLETNQNIRIRHGSLPYDRQ